MCDVTNELEANIESNNTENILNNLKSINSKLSTMIKKIMNPIKVTKDYKSKELNLENSNATSVNSYFSKVIQITKKYAVALETAKIAAKGFQITQENVNMWQQMHGIVKDIGAKIASISLKDIIFDKGKIIKLLRKIIVNLILTIGKVVLWTLAKLPIVGKMFAKLGLMWAQFAAGVKKHGLLKALKISWRKLIALVKTKIAKLSLKKMIKGLIAGIKKIKAALLAFKVVKVLIIFGKFIAIAAAVLVVAKIIKMIVKFVINLIRQILKLTKALNPISWLFGGRNRGNNSVDINYNYNYNAPSFDSSLANSTNNIPSSVSVSRSRSNTIQEGFNYNKLAMAMSDGVTKGLNSYTRNNPNAFNPNVAVNIDGDDVRARIEDRQRNRGADIYRGLRLNGQH